MVLLGVLGGLSLMACGGGQTAAEPPPQAYVERGEYEVGVSALFFHDPDRPFDTWNAAHASDNYKATLAKIVAAGENQIVAAHIWYPVDAGDSTRAATFEDFSSSASSVIQNAYASFPSFFLSSLASEDPASANIFSDQSAMAAMVEEVKGRLISARYKAPIAEGPFPVLIAAHGLGGTSLGWAKFGEYLASYGYVVVAPNFISDGMLPIVFDSPDSRYAQSVDMASIDSAYQTILGESKVITGFYKYFFGQDAPSGFGGSPGQTELRVLPDGGRKVGEMMGQFFTQRVGDVDTIIDGLESLNKGSESCAAEYAQRGQPRHGAEVCGMFAGALDLAHLGVMGHSLGSMTAQFAVAKSDRIVAAVGYNNGPPRYWEPPGIFGDGLAADGQPAGNPKPVMQIHGSEDAFVQNVFRGLMWNMLSAAGGNPEDIWTLEQERVLPTDENPQPIARNAYNRATGDKVIISLKDLNHDAIVDDFTPLFSEQTPIVVNGNRHWTTIEPRTRKGVGQQALEQGFQGESYPPLAWDTIGDYAVYMPTYLRNYYTKNWFDFYLKGDQGGLRFTENPVEEKGIVDIRSSLPDR